MWEVLGITLTSLNMGFADLPTTAYSYDGEATDISRFYKPSLPNIYLDGYAIIDDKNWVTWNLDSGAHTKKLNTGSLTLGLNHLIKITDSTDITLSASSNYSYSGHTPCTDDFNRKYYCANLTAWSDFERNEHVFNNQISLRLSTRW